MQLNRKTAWYSNIKPIRVAEQSKASVCGRSLDGIAGSNPARGIDVCILRVLCAIRWSSLQRVNLSFRGVIQNVSVTECDLTQQQPSTPIVGRYKGQTKKERI